MADRVVIMNKGEIQQIGNPMEVYRTPQTRFVAEFIGTNNIIDGSVVSRTAEACVVETRLGCFVSSNPSNAPIAEGETVHLVVSADLVTINRDSLAPEGNDLVARVVGESFVGNVVTLMCEAKDGQELKVQLQQHALQHLSLCTNEDVKLTFDRQDTLIISTS